MSCYVQRSKSWSTLEPEPGYRTRSSPYFTGAY
nr:MAG TPA: hypothetical protein [Caudoviricetes sp.]